MPLAYRALLAQSRGDGFSHVEDLHRGFSVVALAKQAVARYISALHLRFPPPTEPEKDRPWPFSILTL